MTTGEPPAGEPRPLTTADLPACLALAADRDWPPEERKWAFLLTAGQGWGVDAPDGGLAACAVLTRTGSLTAISMVLVASRYARRGLGTRIMRHLVAESAPATPTLYATAQGRPLYERLGFVATGEVLVSTGRVTGPADGLSRRATRADLPAITALDAEVFGTDRAALLAGLFDLADGVRVLERAGRVTGYAGAWRPSADGTTSIGPLVADDDRAAVALVGDLAAETGGAIRLDVDTRDTALARWAADRGLEPVFRANAMSLGGQPAPGDRRRLRLPFMQALG